MVIIVKIYFIVDINGLVYVGSTSQELKERFRCHKKDKKDNSGSSSKLLDLDNAYIECIEECTEDNRKERERYYINNIDCVNKNKLNFDKKEWDEKNKEKKKQQMKEYYQKNKEKIKEQTKEYMKEYREKNLEKLKQYDKERYQKKKLANSN